MPKNDKFVVKIDIGCRFR